MTDQWTALTKCPKERFSNIVFISSEEFIIAPYNYNKQKADGILKYNTKNNKWITYIKYPKDFQISNCTLSYDETERKLYLLGAESTLYSINLENHKFSKLQNGDVEVGVNPTSLFVEGKLHILGGSRNRMHLSRNLYAEDGDEKQTEFEEGFMFEDWAKGNQNCGLLYIRSKNQFILLGGYNQYCEYKYSDLVWSFDLNPKGNNNNNTKWVKRCKMPERACFFGYLLSSDERYVILIGGYTTGKKLVKRIYVLDVESMKFIKTSNISSPASGSVRATMGEDNNIYLFKHDNGALWRINVQKIISQYDANEDNYAYQLVKKYKKLLKAAEQENRQLKIQLNKEKQVNAMGGKKRKSGKRKSGADDGIINKKMQKKVKELEQLTQEQQTEIRRLEEKVNKQSRYIDDLEGEKMLVKNTSIQQRLKIKELKTRLGDLEEDADQLNSIENFLKKQAMLSAKQDEALAEAGVDMD